MDLPLLKTVFFLLGLVLTGLEFVVPGAVIGFIGLAALFVSALLHFSIIAGLPEALLSFFVSSILFIVFLRSLALQMMPGDSAIQETDEDHAAIGSIVLVTESVLPEKDGRIEFRDTSWSARCAHEGIHKGNQAIICGRVGNTWLIDKI